MCSAAGDVPETKVHYCERFVELLVSLEAQLPTRRFFTVLLNNKHVVVRSRLAPLYARDDGKLFVQLLDMLTFYCGFEINEVTGEALTDGEMTSAHYHKITSLQVPSDVSSSPYTHYVNDVALYTFSCVRVA